jgi:hypothetical protein
MRILKNIPTTNNKKMIYNLTKIHNYHNKKTIIKLFPLKKINLLYQSTNPTKKTINYHL